MHFLGAAGTVTGSRYLLESAKLRVLVDCGLFQGYKNLRLHNWQPPPFDPSTLEAVLLTHAHIDHSGYLPVLMQHGFKGKIFCTEATQALCAVLLRDAAHLFEEEAAYANRHQISKHKPALPLYGIREVDAVLKRFHVVREHQTFQIAPAFSAKWIPNGHILGSMCIACTVDGVDILFSGDLGRPHDVLMKPPEMPARTDYLVVESTYGNRIHDNVDAEKQLMEIILSTVHRGGSILIPAFAVGRSQTLLYLLLRLRRNNRIPNLPIYLDSPMSENVTGIYHRFFEALHLSALDCEDMIAMTRYARTAEDSQRINSDKWPKIVISASGMATGGRVVHHLKNMLPDERNTIVFCGFQAGGTRGEKIASGAQTVRIHAQDVPIRARVIQMDTLSAHADCTEIIAWLQHMRQPPVMTFVTHGEPAAADAMRIRIERELSWPCAVPEQFDCYQIAKNHVQLLPKRLPD
ncbi:MBL fold metallo-hydrolase RNA specificity domain-containing protein [Herminiimonas sp. CN]|uniref:MBL fold metallo-hydrolase RNA specificity domain-containing protein n=1 Tax=Herminiimonas sp. CN TaxID=1349818 RepID=UPI00068647D0|nr:MBL fold metallo-hydrolase [Herminiimonas sp. CN]